VTAANFLVEEAGPPPHLGGLRPGTVRAYSSNLKAARRDVGRPLDKEPDFEMFESVVSALVARPDKSASVTEKDEEWDLPQLLAAWDDAGPNESLPLEILREKAICLTMAAGIARPSDVARLDRDTLVTEAETMSVRVFRGKTTKGGHSPPIVLPFLEEGSIRCAAAALAEYLSRTASIRDEVVFDTSSDPNPVFVTLGRPFTALQSGTISSIVRRVLQRCDIRSRPYSVRNRAATAALDAGHAAHVVQQAGRWATQVTLDRHYSRPRADGEVALSLLRL
jgi:integrase